MTTRYSRREGAPLQEWAGGNEGCWATARPAAPPPAPSREALAKSTSSPPFVSPSCEHSPLRHPSSRPPSLTRALFAASPRPYYRPTLYFGLILRHPASYASFVPLAIPPELLSVLYRVLLSHSLFLMSSVCAARLALLHRVSFVSRRWPGITPAAIFTPGTVRLDIQADECARASIRLAIACNVLNASLCVSCARKRMACFRLTDGNNKCELVEKKIEILRNIIIGINVKENEDTAIVRRIYS